MCEIEKNRNEVFHDLVADIAVWLAREGGPVTEHTLVCEFGGYPHAEGDPDGNDQVLDALQTIRMAARACPEQPPGDLMEGERPL